MHCLTWLVERGTPVSSRDLAELQGVSPTMVAKVMPRLEKAGIVTSTSGINGGYRLARPPEAISVLDVADAIDGRHALFDCKEVRENCVLFSGAPPAWVRHGTCGIHAVMLRAQKSMRAEMARTSLLDLVRGIHCPPDFGQEATRWLDDRVATREQSRLAAMKAGAGRRESHG
jgi:Rrf2 family protein